MKTGEAGSLMDQPRDGSILTVRLGQDYRSSGIRVDGHGGWSDGHAAFDRLHPRLSLSGKYIESVCAYLAGHRTFSICRNRV